MGTKRHPLVDCYIHTFVPDTEKTVIERQGKIIGVTESHTGLSPLYHVQWFSWVDGQPTNITLVTAEQMHYEMWDFYEPNNYDTFLRKGHESVFGPGKNDEEPF